MEYLTATTDLKLSVSETYPAFQFSPDQFLWPVILYLVLERQHYLKCSISVDNAAEETNAVVHTYKCSQVNIQCHLIFSLFPSFFSWQPVWLMNRMNFRTGIVFSGWRDFDWRDSEDFTAVRIIYYLMLDTLSGLNFQSARDSRTIHNCN